MLEQIEAGNLIQDLKMNDLQAILYIIKSFSDNLCETNDSELRDLISSLDMLCLSNVVYEVLSENRAIKELAYMFKSDKNTEAMNEENTEALDEKMDDSIEPALISSSLALNSLESV
ncbi:1189_t:CDS:2 [Cetraspora pellucida]|uniref:1189_t:CDS:1 n=1 Tax=Cetraspora pellucida TaxID=1433469 RepID=A0ACA9KHU8_9GLOM|nr:1189_t:CDS:2 [Cetraspora pellucida]